MKKCMQCGKTYDDSVEFCEACGTQLVAEAPQQTPPIYQQPQQQQYGYQNTAPQQPVNNEPVTIGEWMLMLINLVPCVGSIAWIIILFVWAFGSNVKMSKKTFARANLIIWAIGIGLALIYYIVLIGLGIGMAGGIDTLDDLFNM